MPGRLRVVAFMIVGPCYRSMSTYGIFVLFLSLFLLACGVLSSDITTVSCMSRGFLSDCGMSVMPSWLHSCCPDHGATDAADMSKRSRMTTTDIYGDRKSRRAQAYVEERKHPKRGLAKCGDDKVTMVDRVAATAKCDDEMMRYLFRYDPKTPPNKDQRFVFRETNCEHPHPRGSNSKGYAGDIIFKRKAKKDS